MKSSLLRSRPATVATFSELTLLFLAAGLAWYTRRAAVNDKLNRSLIIAVYTADLPRMKVVLDAGADPNARERSGVEAGWLDCVRQVFSPTTSTRDSDTALIIAVRMCQSSYRVVPPQPVAARIVTGPDLQFAQGDPRVVEMLLSYGADPNLHAGRATAVSVAGDDRHIIELLVRHGAKADELRGA